LVAEYRPQLEEKAAAAIAPTRHAWCGRVAQLFDRSHIGRVLREKLDRFLVAADVGGAITIRVLDRLRARARPASPS
jgi:hypothetical protein